MELNKEVSKETALTADITAKGVIVSANYDGKYANASLKVEVKAIDLLRELAKRTDNKIDDGLVELVAKALE